MPKPHPQATLRPIDHTRVVPDDFEQAAGTFALLASPIRVQLLWLLSEASYDVSSLAAKVDATVATTSHHLGKLRLAGLVNSTTQGRRQVYSLEDPHVVSLVNEAVDHHADLRARLS